MSQTEAKALQRGDGETFKMLAAIAQAEDTGEALRSFKPIKREKPKAKLAPSVRMSMLEAIAAGSRHR